MPQQSRRVFLVLNGNTKALIFYKLIYGYKAGTHFNTYGWQTKPVNLMFLRQARQDY